jgi:hypothetical protein
VPRQLIDVVLEFLVIGAGIDVMDEDERTAEAFFDVVDVAMLPFEKL